MKVFIINGHHPYPFSKGRLNATLVTRARELLEAEGHEVQVTTMHEDIDALDVDAELAKHAWADLVLLQTPVNWMGVSWSFKRYMDLVYTAGMDGRLCQGDGRTREQPKANYGRGGTLTDTRYMLSLTLNAPAQAFGREGEFFGRRGIDELFWPMHLNFEFFGMRALPSFACFDVMKNADIETDLARFDAHLREHVTPVLAA